MAYNITLSSSMRSNLMSLKNIAAQMDKTQNILSTGKKVNSAIDNASSYYQARSLTNRAADLSSLLDAMGQGIQTLQAASEGLESATSYLEQMKSVAEQALALPDNSNTTNAPQKVPMQSKVELVDNSAELIDQGYTTIDSSMSGQDIRNLIDELGEGAKLVLTEDVEIDDGISFGGNNVTINGGGHSLKMGGGLSAYSHGFKLENIDVQFEGSTIGVYYGGTIKNANLSFVLDDNPYMDTLTLINASQDITIDNVNVTATGYDSLVGVQSYDYDIDIKNLTMDLTSTNGSVIGVRSEDGNINVDNMYIATDNDNATGIITAGTITGVENSKLIIPSLTDGKANTQAIVNQLKEDGKAAYATTQFYVGDKKGEFGQGKWYLPSIGELMDLYGTDYEAMEGGRGSSGANGDNFSAIKTTLGELSKDGIAEEMDGYYWSSSEYDSTDSWMLYTFDGGRATSGKDGTNYARAFRLVENCFNPSLLSGAAGDGIPKVGDIMYQDGSWGTLEDYDSSKSDQVAGVICGVGDDGSVKVVSLKDLTFSSDDDAGVFNPEDPYGGSSKHVSWATDDKWEEDIDAVTNIDSNSITVPKIATIEDINKAYIQIEGGATNPDTLTVPDEPVEPAAATYSLRRSAPAQDNTSEGATAATYSLRRSAPAQEPMAIDEPVEINATYADYIKQYDQLINEFNNLLADASYQGVNLLIGGKLNVTFNESRTHNMTVNGKDMRTDNIGLNMKNWSSKADIETAIKQIVDAMNEVRSFSADLGNKYTIIQTRQNFTDALCDVLETGADDLVLADMNEASAEYLMLQTRQQLATNSLSLASQSASSILSLFI